MPELYIVSTPIGNLEDITLRAIRTLKEVDFIICEDTRYTGKLLKHLNIQKPLISFHGYSGKDKAVKLLERIVNGEKAALVTDSGTPGISDPGYLITSGAAELGIKLIPIPGPSAFLTALQGSGAPINQFTYIGFLPVKKGRQTLLKKLKEEEDKTIVLYESVHRIQKTLSELAEHLGKDRKIIVARELTKMFEEFFRGTIGEAIKHFNKPKGEFVVIIPAE